MSFIGGESSVYPENPQNEKPTILIIDSLGLTKREKSKFHACINSKSIILWLRTKKYI